MFYADQGHYTNVTPGGSVEEKLSLPYPNIVDHQMKLDHMTIEYDDVDIPACDRSQYQICNV